MIPTLFRRCCLKRLQFSSPIALHRSFLHTSSPPLSSLSSPLPTRGIVSEIIPGDEQHVEVTDNVHTDPGTLSTDGLRRRLLLNSRYRGRVETELFLGGFAAARVWDMSEQELREFEYILAEQDIDLFNWLMGNQPMPEQLQKLPVMQQIVEYISQKTQKSSSDNAQPTWNEDYNTDRF